VVDDAPEVCATSRLAVLNVDTMARVWAGASGFGAGSLTVVEAVEAVLSAAFGAAAFFFFLRVAGGWSSVDDGVAAASLVSALLVVFAVSAS
jgi:hypothetical protein